MNPKKDYKLLTDLRKFHKEFIDRIPDTTLTLNDLLRMDSRIISKHFDMVKQIEEFDDILIKYEIEEIVQITLKYGGNRTQATDSIFERIPDYSVFSTIKIKKIYDNELIDMTITPNASKVMFPKHRTQILHGPYNFGDNEVSFTDISGVTLSVKDIKREYNLQSLPDDYWSWTPDDILLLKLSIDEN